MSRSLLSLFTLVTFLLPACIPAPAARLMAESTAMPETAPLTGALEAPASLDLPPLLVRAANSGLLYPLDPATGRSLPGYAPIPTGPAYTQAFSPDGRRLAFVSEKGVLTLIDLPAWTHQTYELELPRPVFQAAFSPDGNRLVVAAGRRTSSLALIDLDKIQVGAERAPVSNELDFLVHQMKFTADGAGLMVYGTVIEKRFTENEMSPEPAQVALLDGEDLDVLWSEVLEGVQHGIVPKDGADPDADLHQPGQAMYMLPGLAWAPDRDALHIAHAGQELLTTIDFSARQVARLEIHERVSWLERLISLGAGQAQAKVAEGTTKEAAVSPDGGRLYLVGGSSRLVDRESSDWEVVYTPLGMQVIDIASGERLEWHESQATSLSLSPMGESLYLRTWQDEQPWTEVFDIESGQVTSRLEGVYLEPVRGLDGRVLLASILGTKGDTIHVTLVDPDSLEVVGKWSHAGYLSWVSPR